MNASSFTLVTFERIKVNFFSKKQRRSFLKNRISVECGKSQSKICSKPVKRMLELQMRFSQDQPFSAWCPPKRSYLLRQVILGLSK